MSSQEAKHHLDRHAADLAASISKKTLSTATTLPDENDLLSTEELALWLRISPQTLKVWRMKVNRKKGIGPPFINMGPKCTRYRRGAVLTWLMSRERSQAGVG